MALTLGQKKCIETLDKPLAVSAGAGSGKTFTLTRRIVNALSTGAVSDVERIVAITYTNKAAAELKSRIRSALRAEGMLDQALKVDSAWISTIHGMCSRMLKEHALEVGVDPDFEMIDETVSKNFLEESLDEVLCGVDDIVAPEGLDALFAEYGSRSYGNSAAGSVYDMVSELVESASADPRGIDALSLPKAQDKGVILRRMVELGESLLASLEGQKAGKTRDGLRDKTQFALEKVTDALGKNECIADEQALELINLFPVPGGNFGDNEYKDFARGIAQDYMKCASELRDGCAVAYLQDLISLARQVFNLFQEKKRAQGMLDNNDLLTLTARAFETCPAMIEDYADRFQLIMIDEFQDTDQVQVDMISHLSGERGERLCTVGDAQQSIYRFRGADVSVYRRQIESVLAQNPEGLILLPDNFRSHADVLSFVDRIFEQPDVFGKQFMSLSAARDESRVQCPFLGSGARVDVSFVTYPSQGVSPDEVTRASAHAIAQRFAVLHEAGHAAGDMVVLLRSTTHADVYATALREAGLTCVVVKGSIFNRAPEVKLMVSLAKVIANPLDTCALFEVLSSEMFALAADDYLYLSTYVDDKGKPHSRPLWQGLMSCFPEIGEEGGQLEAREMRGGFEGRETRGEYEGGETRENLDRREMCETSESSGERKTRARLGLESAVRTIRAAVRDAGRIPTSEIMQRVILDCGWLTRLEKQGAEGQACAANVLKAIRVAATLEAEATLGPVELASVLARKIDLMRDAPGALTGTDGDFVRIMTVHASKGLEFPIVAVAELGMARVSAKRLELERVQKNLYVSLNLSASTSDVSSTSLLGKTNASAFGFDDLSEDALASQVVKCESAGERRALISTLRKKAEEQEALRLLYVALTRAKEALVVSLTGKRTKDNPNGAGRGIVSYIQSALCGVQGQFESGRATYDFGASMPAVFERIDLEAKKAPESEASGIEASPESLAVSGESASTDAWVASGAAGASCALVTSTPPELFDIVVASDKQPFYNRAVRAEWKNVFSYTSISDVAKGEQDGRDEQVVRDAQDVIGAQNAYGAQDADDAYGAQNEQSRTNGFASINDPISINDEAWAEIDARLMEDVSATDFGVVFHRLAQYAVETRASGGPLKCPSDERIGALCNAYGLSQGMRSRLSLALARWFSSLIAVRVAAFSQLRAEVPFFLRLESEGEPIYLEGEIDLLATMGTTDTDVLVIDYKTGGHDGETIEYLCDKHRLQAMCYALAILKQGYPRVELVFVRVEQVDNPSSNEPQCVRYIYKYDEITQLESNIVTLWQKAQLQKG